MSKMMVKRDGLWTPMANLKGDTGPLPADNSVTNDALVTDGAKTNTAYLMGNRLTKDAEGEFISVDDSYPSAALSLTVDGKSTQVTTTGKNLIPTTMPSNAIHATISGSGSDISGTLASAGNAWVYAIPCERNTQYVYQASRNGAIGAIGLSNTDSLHVNDTVWKVATVTYISSRTFSSGEYDYILLQNTNTAEFNNMPANKVMLSVGSSITDYETYSGGAASPRPDWPQEIESIINPFLSVSANNFLNTIEWVENAFINERGLIISSADAHYTLAFSPVNKVAYTLVMPRLSAGQSVVRLHGYDKNKKWVKQIYTVSLNPGTTTYSANITIPEGVSFVRISTTKGETAYLLRLDSTVVDYEPYSGNYAQLQDITLRSLPDGTKDELYLTYLRPSSREGWAWYEPTLMQRVGYDVKPVVANLIKSSTMDYVDINVASVSRSPAACTHLINDGTSGVGKCAVSSTGKMFLLMFEPGSFSTDADAQTWIDENNVEIHYILATPITTQLDPIELPIMQAGMTNIWTDPSTSLSVTYERDRNIVISKLEAAAADLATS